METYRRYFFIDESPLEGSQIKTERSIAPSNSNYNYKSHRFSERSEFPAEQIQGFSGGFTLQFPLKNSEIRNSPKSAKFEREQPFEV